MLGTRAVLTGVCVVIVAQLVFTFAPFMQAVFETRPVELVDGLVVVMVGVALLGIVELEKRLQKLLPQVKLVRAQRRKLLDPIS